MGEVETISDAQLELRYWPHWLPADAAWEAYARLRDEIAWEHGEVKLFGKTYKEPRLSAWYGDQQAVYTYSGKTLAPKPWTPLLLELKDKLEAQTGTAFNSVLLNLYRDGLDSMGAHSDNEPELGPEPAIASLSLGAVRRFVLRHKREHTRRHELLLAHGSLLLMSGPTQQHWKHSLPKTKGVDQPRINLTFRKQVTSNS